MRQISSNGTRYLQDIATTLMAALRTAASRSGALLRTTLVALTAAYLLLASLPFYGYGINQRPLTEITASLVDPKSYFPFSLPLLGGLAQALGVYSAHLVPWLSLFFAPAFLLSLIVTWQQLRRAQALLGIAILAINAASLLLTWGSAGLIGLWLAD